MDTGNQKRSPSATVEGKHKAEARRKRRADSLRANLGKRKQQRRARDDDGGGDDPRREG
jgi:hypothetical protein